MLTSDVLYNVRKSSNKIDCIIEWILMEVILSNLIIESVSTDIFLVDFLNTCNQRAFSDFSLIRYSALIFYNEPISNISKYQNLVPLKIKIDLFFEIFDHTWISDFQVCQIFLEKPFIFSRWRFNMLRTTF